MIKEFDILTHPLELGTQSLIEASAGTGKTTALENLVLRLLIDGVATPGGECRMLKISEILLVTFTEAATDELVQRVRDNISHALEMLKKDELEDDLTGRILANSAKSKKDMKLALHMALLSFDENAISTIHGFCRKMLSNFAFESNSRFNLELINDDRLFLQELVNDYWRAHFYDIPEMEAKILKASNWNPGILHKLLKNIQSSPLTKISMPDTLGGLRDAYAEFEEYCLNSKLPHFMAEKKDNFKKDFKAKLENAINCYDSFDDVFPLIKVFNAAGDAVKQRPKPNWDGCEDAVPSAGKLPKDFDYLLELAAKLESSIVDYLARLKFDFIKYVRESGALKQKKLDEGVLSFDDLLIDMHEAVKSKTFCKLICEDFPVVMIDEFQDTDPLQFQIFNRIFKNDDSLMLMVGDPKQSIYQFRGADIFSYLQVSKNLTGSEKSTLTKNYRSDETLIDGINTIFDIDNPFVEDAINFISASSGREQRKLVFKGVNEGEPLKILNGGDIAKTAALEVFSKTISDRIVAMLSPGKDGHPAAYFENDDGSREPVRARDIAILTDRKSDAQKICEQLANAGVQATLQHSGNIFDSDEAAGLLLLFNAIIRPGDASKIKSVLATNLFRLKASELGKLGSESGTDEMEAWQELFFTLLQVWQEKGFIQMFFHLLRSPKSNVKANLLSLPQGERRLTNFLHLMELLHQQSVKRNLSPTALIYWLHQQITDPDEKEEHELRLESDESAVKIMTVHKSKGLQFPIVFCLNLWHREFVPYDKNEDFFYHDEEFKQHFEIKSSDEEFVGKYRLRCKENLGELIRLTYVALTRAKNYCCFTWIDKPNKSGLAYLAGHPPEDKLGDFLENGGSRTGIPLNWQGSDNIEIINIAPEDAGGDAKLTTNIEAPEWKMLPELRNVPRDWGIMSFSAITEGSHHEHEIRPGDDDENNENDNIPVENIDLFSGVLPLGDFPRGPVAGNCIHSIFEKFKFSDIKSENWRKNRTIEQMIKTELFISGMIDGIKGSMRFEQAETQRYTQVCDMLENVLTCPLPGRDGTMNLCDLDTENCRPEMQFFFPADKILDSRKVNELLFHLSGRKSNLPAAPLRGFVNGFIDLVFEFKGRYYIIDWKSNDLGSSLNDYDLNGMAQSMYESYYYLQSAIYLLALHKYLKNRLPDYDFEKHIGGAFYLYVRGIKNDFADTGVFPIRPELKTLQLLENIFEAE